MDQGLRDLVRERARNRCEYCHLPASVSLTPHQVEHVIARQHGGETVEGNLAWACLRCNLHKGPNISGIDPKVGTLTRLYHPRLDTWGDHFDWIGAELVGTTPIGRTTVVVLNVNDPARLDRRARLMREGRFF